MQETDLHDLSDDPDYTALQHQDTMSNSSSKSVRMCDSSKSEIVYSKENVAVHPSQYASERISGRLCIIKQGSSFFLKSLSSLELPRVLSVANGTPMQGSPNEVSSIYDSMRVDGITASGTSSAFEYRGRHRRKTHDPTHDLSIHVLEKFSLVTKFAREATTQLFGEFHESHELLHDREQKDSSPLDAAVVSQPNDAQSKADSIVATSDSTELDKLSLVWGKPRQSPLNHEEWETFLDSEGRVMNSNALIKRIFYGGLEHELRKEVWKFLLGYYEYESTYAEREYLESVRKLDYETIKSQWKSISVVQAKRFTKFRERKSLIDKDVVRTDRSVPYFEGDDNPNVIVLRDILLTYSFYNFDLGYCQGMSDLLSPILFVMRDEYEAFWSFVALMERLGPNFNRDQSGMHSQLFALSKLVELLDHSLHNYFRQADCLNYFFCFRWILIQFKREFEYEKTMHLWEVLWTHHLSEHFHLYICIAILKSHKKKIMEEQMDFDTLLKFINGLSNQIDLDSVIRDAEALCVCAGGNGAACIPPGTPPSCPVDLDAGLYDQQDDEILKLFELFKLFPAIL
ncbi:hypothetical protein IEQ34_019051 [Dendrobium chrysotoxum]|uniref:TBC1 domain family member 15 n=1 Tax=Dendrobium chrysotoxum TaxID=161865 RepID=A0AAV7G6D2_DENCH|nr:hypothetical protein IEQ34_019051 [Dendrobium chrysotoxum]